MWKSDNETHLCLVYSFHTIAANVEDIKILAQKLKENCIFELNDMSFKGNLPF